MGGKMRLAYRTDFCRSCRKEIKRGEYKKIRNMRYCLDCYNEKVANEA